MLKTHGTRLSQIKLSWMSWLGLSGAVSCCALVLVFGLMLFPTLPQKTNALDWTPDIENKPVTDPSGTSVGINLPASIDFDSVTPTPDGATTTATADLTVTTTNSASYSLYLYSSDGDNSLRPKISANISQINATAGDVGLTLSSLKPNTWGYNLGTEAPTDSTTYSAVPTDNSAPIQTKNTTSTNSANDTYTLSFGAKVDTTIPSGTYSNTLTIAVVAEPAMVTVAFNGNGATSGSMSSIKIPAGGSQALPSNVFTRNGYVFNGWNTASNGSGTSYADGANYTASTSYAGQTVTLYAQWRLPINHLGDVTYMQDFTSTLCATSEIGATTRLTDSRDGKQYWVAKLADGNCWMTQNLELDLSNRTLTPSDSDVTSNWRPGITMFTSGSSGSDLDGDAVIQAWNLGNYVWSTPDDDTNCGYTTGNLSYCSQFINVSNMTPMTEIREDGVVIDGNTYDAHYKAGYYYSWNAATAGSGGTMTSGNATSSICPAGWELSYGGYSSSPKSFYNLLRQYDLDRDTTSDSTGFSITRHPLYFVRSGDVRVLSDWQNANQLQHVGAYGHYWSSASNSDPELAYNLAFRSDSVSPNVAADSGVYNGSRNYGYSVRCVAQ